MREKILVTIVVLGIFLTGVAVAIFIRLPLPQAQDPNQNPFTKIGQMATQNGLVVEIYSLEHPKAKCVVAVQQIPSEIGRAMFQMVCK